MIVRGMGSSRSWMLLAALVAGSGGCGPIAYVNQVTRDASTKVEHARELGAETASPYWWTRATTYLRMAREVGAHADYQGANRFGRLAAEAADKAAAEAETVPAAASPKAKARGKRPEHAPAKDAE